MSERRGMLVMVTMMVLIVASANYLVQFPVSDWLTWGALTYPVSYLVTDLCNRCYGPERARRVIYVGFVLAVILSAALASPRIALASGTAFLISQLMDVAIFNRMRAQRWWRAPLTSSVVGSLVDTALFFTLAFSGTDLPWVTLAIGDYAVKVAIALVLLGPYRVIAARG